MNVSVEKARSIISEEMSVPALEELQALLQNLETEGELLVAVRLLAKSREVYPRDELIMKRLKSLAYTAVTNIVSEKDPLPEYSDVKSLVTVLKANLNFRLAGKLLDLARPIYSEETWIVQQMALCTYKDEEVLPETRFQQALKYLEEIGLRKEDTDNPETLSLGGAVYKRMWEYHGQLEYLYESLAFYRAGWAASLKPEPGTREQHSPPRDYGYSAVNSAYILDILASRARVLSNRTGRQIDEEARCESEAKHVREDALSRLEKALTDNAVLEKYDWFAVTLAELHFGLGHYPESGEWVSNAMERGPSEWEIQTSFKQFVSIARLHQILPPKDDTDPKDWHPAWIALSRFLGEVETVRALSCYRGKVGLSLSGGGFRASLFHLGVLARLAEMDVLHSVEALSTVSGGSIIGALYYLEVQHLLQSRKDHDISRTDYIEIVRRVQERFLDGVQENLRTRTLSDISINVKMIYTSEYSRSHRLGELYEDKLYSLIGKDEKPFTEPRTMNQLLITPADHVSEEPFKPKFLNWRRRSKVPVLLLNTTSLNSGHSWHFTARWMGEPPGSVNSQVDVNERYRRLWYNQAPEEKHRNYRLGYAVAASACVPGLFEPLELEDLYPGRTVRLVDGGVHDNQGVEALLDEGCTLVLCSDASGQMEDLKRPSDSILGVPLRSNSILMDRVREAEYENLRGRADSRALQGLFFIHLKKGLDPLPIDWIKCQDPTVPPHCALCTTSYGVDKDLQRKLADIRTDLDSFSEVEAYSLMLSGYLMTEHEFKELDDQHSRDGEKGSWGGYDIKAPRQQWRFLDLENIMRQTPDSSDARREELGKQLEAGSSLFFKIWKLNPTLRKLSWMGGTALIILLLWFIYAQWDTSITLLSVTVGGLALFLLFTILMGIFPVLKWLKPHQAVRGYLTKALFALTGFIVTNIHLKIFDPLFIKWGKLDRLLRLK